MNELQIEEVKRRIHQIVNHLQAILGYLELGEYEQSTKQISFACENVRALEKILCKDSKS